MSRRLAECAACREELAGWRNTLAMLQGLDDVPAPRSFTLAGPPPAPVAALPPVPLRAPQWVYAGAASMAGLALAVMVSLDAAGLAPPTLPTNAPGSASQFSSQEQAPQPAIAQDSAPGESDAPPEAPPESEAMRAAGAPEDADGPQITRAVPPDESDDTPAPFALEATSGPEPTAAPAPGIEGDGYAADGAVGPAAPPGPLGAGNGPAGPTGPEEEAPTADPAPVYDHVLLSQAKGTPVLWRILQGTAGALLVVLLGALVLKRRTHRQSSSN